MGTSEMVTRVGIEPTTNWLKASCSTAELPGRRATNDSKPAVRIGNCRTVPPMWRSFAAMFATVFLAEIGDKTQLATMLFSAEGQVSRWVVFAASATALVTAAAIGVIVGAQLERFIKPQTLKIVAGIGFVAIGLWTIFAR